MLQAGFCFVLKKDHRRFLLLEIGYRFLSEINNSILVFFSEEPFLVYLLVQVIACVGMTGLFRKMSGKKSWLGIIPGINYARLGILCGQKALGVIYGFVQLFLGVGFLMIDPYSDESIAVGTNLMLMLDIALLAIIVLTLFQMIVGIFLFKKLIDLFGESRWWLLPFTLIPHLTLLFWGISPRIRE